jgi:hypothetical protein
VIDEVAARLEQHIALRAHECWRQAALDPHASAERCEVCAFSIFVLRFNSF